MNDEIIVFEMPDKTIRYSICPRRDKKPGETRSEWLHRAFTKTVRSNPKYAGAVRINNAVMPDGKPLTIGEDDHPAEHAVRDAWRHDGKGRIVIDPVEAAKIRAEAQKPTLEERLAKLENENATLGAEVDDLTLRIPPR